MSQTPQKQDAEQKAEQTGENQGTEKGISFFSFMGSILSGWFGVQSKANQERDFQHGKFHHFILGGLLFAVLFVLFIVGLVKVVMHFAVGQ